jgi:hypothetical protein
MIYPAEGYISMAIEDARQRALVMNLSIDGYDLRQINVSQALVIPSLEKKITSLLYNI